MPITSKFTPEERLKKLADYRARYSKNRYHTDPEYRERILNAKRKNKKTPNKCV